MTLWFRIADLARQLLGESSARPVDLSRIALDLASRSPDTAIPPPHIEQPKPDAEIEVVPEYEFVVGAIREGAPVTFVTGRAGTGKSTLIRYIVSTVRGCVVVSPTGTAAVNVGGVTIHSFFGFPPRVMNPDDARDPKRESADVIRALGALIVDEVSMVTPDLVDAIDAAMRRTREDPRPFGGVPIVLVGDLLQLPPVVADPEVARFYSHRYPSPYFFSADVFREAPIVAVELTRVFRQADADFIDLLDRIRTNRDHRDAVARLNRECWRDVSSDTTSAMWLVPTNAAAATLNAERLEQLHAPESTFDAVIEGKVAVLVDRFPAPARLVLRPGARVIFVKNRKPWWVNGTTGTVIRIDSVNRPGKPGGSKC
jgi:hypothetical protein